MNILKLLDRLSDDKFFTTETSRLETLTQISSFGKKAAVAAAPLGLGALMTNSAKAQTTNTTPGGSTAKDALTDALKLALTLEYLEDDYYAQGLAKSGLIPSSDRPVIMQIAKHETAHVAFLKSALTSLNVVPPAKPNFNYNVGGLTPMTEYSQFLTLAQAFEDTGVRAYKGQAGNVMGNKAILQAALQIHSVEARHASQIRRMRGKKGWIEAADGGIPDPFNTKVYAGEDLTVQAGFNAAGPFGGPAGSAAYDEILTGDAATAIAAMFIV